MSQIPMKSSGFSTPILLLVFNRPDLVHRQIDELRLIKPAQLYIAADGPRPGNPNDLVACNAVREVLDQIDWPCEVQTLFRKQNLGCRLAVSTAITWFFKNVPAGIILEDDCFPDPSFFTYCQKLLAKYKNNPKIMHIAGTTLTPGIMKDSDYDFSIHPLAWGWASWRRAWKKYDLEMHDWPQKGLTLVNTLFRSQSSRNYWSSIFFKMYRHEIDTWDYQWIYSIWKQKGLCIVPKQNLVSNQGFDGRATHTKIPFSPYADLATTAIEFPLTAPKNVIANEKLNDAIETTFETSASLKAFKGLFKYLSQTKKSSDPQPMATKDIIIKAHPKWFLINLSELYDFRELFYIFSWRDIKVRYKQTAIGVGWVLFQPIINTLIFTVFFGNFAKIPSNDLPYPLFVLLGLIFWTFFSTSLSHAANSFIENTAILGKVYFPREILPLSSIGVGLVDFSVSFILFILVALFYHSSFSLAFIAMVVFGLIVTIISSSGLGLLIASVNVKYRDVRYILPYFLQMMIFVTPVIYPLNIMRPALQKIILLNPMTGVIDSLRFSLVHGQIGEIQPLLFAFVSAVVFLLAGLIYFRKTQAFFADQL